MTTLALLIASLLLACTAHIRYRKRVRLLVRRASDGLLQQAARDLQVSYYDEPLVRRYLTELETAIEREL